MFWVGTSGYNYPEWKGSFYPDDLPAKKMLPYYAARFPTVEINYTFYRMPTEKLVAGWAEQTPSPYKLTLKAPRRITHDKRLKDTGDDVKFFCDVAGTLGEQARHAAVPAAAVPEEGSRAAGRVPRRAAGERPGGLRVPARVVVRRRGVRAAGRAQPGRLHRRQREALDAGSHHRATTRISGCATRGISRTTSSAGPTPLRAMPPSCRDVFVYFKHEESGKGPEFARLLMDCLGV